MRYSFDETEPIIDRAIGDHFSPETFFEVHQAFTYLLDAEPTIPESAYDNIVRSLATVHRYAVAETCKRVTASVTDVLRDLANTR